jgi:methionine synthase II (cobalamin-independent)
MDHEFCTNESNFRIFERRHFEDTDKFLGMGSVQTNFSPIKDGELKDYVESIDVLKKFLRKGIDQYGQENLVIKPDCGFGALKGAFEESFIYDIVIKKLNNMVLSVKELK